MEEYIITQWAACFVVMTYLFCEVTSMLAPPGSSSTSFWPPIEVSVTAKVRPKSAMSPCSSAQADQMCKGIEVIVINCTYLVCLKKHQIFVQFRVQGVQIID